VEGAKKLITFCSFSRAKVASVDDLKLLLSVVENTACAEDEPTTEDGDYCHVTDTTATPDRDD
jgi:hypothetical protein